MSVILKSQDDELLRAGHLKDHVLIPLRNHIKEWVKKITQRP